MIRRAWCVLPMAALLMVGCGREREGTTGAGHDSCEAVPEVVTADIEAGIVAHIEEQTRRGEGYFDLVHDGEELRLKLVRVHTEYLANLGPGRHFACVDLVCTDGDVYDVDFFLSGEPGAMTVTETTAHKINGRPLYLWEQASDKTWYRVTTDGASEALLGVVRGEDAFEFRYRASLPEIGGPARMWLPLPSSDAFQTVEMKEIRAPGKRSVLEERAHGNRVLFLELGPVDGGKTVEMRFHVTRKEKKSYVGDSPDAGLHLASERLTPVGAAFRKTAEEVTRGKSRDLIRARALYDHVLDRMRYMKHGPGWGKGDATYACDTLTGNCSDFHAYFIALARSIGIPARFAIGAAIPSDRDAGGIDGYHCWAEFYADGAWWPVDISEGNKFSSLATYYFGHHPANRFELSRGRDLVVEPGPASGPINFLAYPVLEIGGKPAPVRVQFSFARKR